MDFAKRLLTLILPVFMLLTSCSGQNELPEDTTEPPTHVSAPTVSDTDTSAPVTTKAPETTEQVTAAPESTSMPIDVITTDTTAEPVEESSSDSAEDSTEESTTAALEVVDPVIFTYRVHHITDTGIYLLDADYNMSFVKPEENPIFHKTSVTRVGEERIVYCSDLNTTILLTGSGEVRTVAKGRLASPVSGHWIVYASAQANKFRLYNVVEGVEFSEDLRGYNSRPDGKLVLLGSGESIYISDGEQIVDSRSYDLIYYFAMTYALVRENGSLRFYNTNFELLADWGKIAGSNRIKFDETKRSDSGFEFFFEESSFKYTFGQPIIEGSQKIVSSSKLTLLKSGDKYLAYMAGEVTEIELPEISIIYANAENCLELIDKDLNVYCYELAHDGLKEIKLHSRVESIGNLKLINTDNHFAHSYILDKSNNVLVAEYCDFKNAEKFIIGAYQGSEVIMQVYTLTGKQIASDESPILSLLANGNLFVADENQYRIYDENGSVTYKSAKFDRVFTIVEEKVLVLEKTTLKLLNIDGKALAVFGDMSTALDPAEGYAFHGEDGYSGLKVHETSGNPTFYFTFSGKRGGQPVAFEFTFDTVTGECRRVDGVQLAETVQ